MLTSPPLAPKTLAALQHAGIATLANLQQLGSVYAFLCLKAQGLTVTRSTLWQLEALVRQQSPQNLDAATRQRLLDALQEHPPVALFPSNEEMQQGMLAAIKQAEYAAAMGEIPVGAVVVYQGNIIAQSHNRCIHDHNISHHAEILALAQAGQILQNYRLEECDVYITLEPCAMCASALIQSRIKRVIFGAYEHKTGAAGSVINLFAEKKLNSHTAIRGGILEDSCRKLLQDFFSQRRKDPISNN